MLEELKIKKLNKKKPDRGLLLKIADLEWLCWFPKKHLIFEELSVLSKELDITYVEDNGILVGFCIFSLEKDVIYFSDLVVHPNYQNRGIATKFIADLIGKLKSTQIGIVCGIKDEFIESGTFLKKFGFSCTNKDGDIYNFLLRNENYKGQVVTK